MSADLPLWPAALVALTCFGLLVFLGVILVQRGRARSRLLDTPMPALEPGRASRAADTGDEPFAAGLAHWLALAGWRDADATKGFIVATLGFLVVGCLAAWILQASGIPRSAAASAHALPGNFGDIVAGILLVSPLFLVVVPPLLPVIMVRAARRRRVRELERDMPLALELLATLGEAGFGLDASIARLLEAQSGPRPLAEELQFSQAELRAGVPRVRCLRRLAARVGVPSMTVFVSAIVQAEQVGAGTAGVLRRQADDLRSRRREDALVRAQALPVKLVFPLVICFLPGLFLVTLGPAFHQFAQLVDSALTNVGR